MSRLFWVFADKPVRILERVIIFIYLAQFLGPELFGTVVEVNAMIMLPIFLLEMGLRVVIQRDFINGESYDLAYKSLRGLGGILYSAVVLIMAYFSGLPLLVFQFVIVFTLVRALLIWDYRQFALLALREYRVYSLIEIGSTLVSVIFLFISIYFNSSLLVIFIAVFSGKIVKSLAYIRTVRIFPLRIEYDFHKFKEALPWVVSNMAGLLLLRMDIYMIDLMLNDTSSSAQYGTACMFNEFWWFVPTSLGVFWSKDILSNKKNITYYYGFVVLLSLSFIIFSWFLGDYLVFSILGKEYSEAASLLKVLSISGVGVAVFPILKWHLARFNMDKYAYLIQISALVLNFILNILFIPLYGLTGAAIASSLSLNISIFSFVIFKNFIFKRHLTIN